MREELTGKILKQKGQTTLEILIAVAIIVMGLSAAIMTFIGGQSLTIDTRMSNRAVLSAREMLENAERNAALNFNGLKSSSSTEDIFKKEIFVTDFELHQKEVISRVSWQTDPLRIQKVELTSLVTNWRALLESGGDTGGEDPSGDWQNPRTLGSVDLGPGNAATDLDIKNKIVYMTAVAAATAKPDFFVISAINGQSPMILGSTSTGPGLLAVDTAENYAYVGNNDPDIQLQIIDLTNLNRPTLVKSFQLNGVTGSGAVGNAIFYSASKIYIGTKNANGPEFHIIDVSDPINPIELGSYEINADLNMIYISGDTAFLATSDDNAEVILLDVNNPAAITNKGLFNLSNAADGLSVYLTGLNLYVGRSASGDPEFYILDVSNPSAIQILGNYNTDADINGILVRDKYTFLGTSDSNKEFQVLNIENPANITAVSSFNFPQVATGIDYENNRVYTAVRSNDALRIITSQ